MINKNELKHPEEFPVSNIFANTEYKIPIYQRSYAWTKEEIEQLLEDIKDSSGDYYIGSLIVDHVETNLYMVIDGQQRLTTLYLLLTYLGYPSISSNSLTFEARDKSNRTLKDLFENKISSEDSLYSSEILNGYRVISAYFDAVDEEEREQFKANIKAKLSNIFIIRTLVPKEIDLNHYFEIMNTRGEQLEIHEVAKGRLIGVIEDSNDKEIAAYIWDACSQMDKYVQMCFDTEAREYLFGPNWNTFSAEKFDDLREKIKIKKLVSSKKFSLKNKLDHPEDNSETFFNEPEENERFESIITFPNFLLITNEVLNISSEDAPSKDDDASLDDKKFIDELKIHWDSNDSALKFIFNLLKLRFLFDKYIIKREFAREYKEEGRWSLQHLEMYQDSGNQKKPMYKLTYNLTGDDSEKDKTNLLKILQSALRITYTSPKTMHWISKALCALNKNEKYDVTQLLEKYACDKVCEANYLTTNGFSVDRIVFTYLDYVLWRDNKSEFEGFQFQFRTSIEHFFPQNPETDSWKGLPDDPLNNFGNLALITVSANSKFSNLLPQAKVYNYKDIINQSPKLMRMAKLMDENGQQWTPKEAKQHGDSMRYILKKEIERHQ